MNRDILDAIKISSNVPEKIINEASTSGDVASTYDFISSLIDSKYNDSLAFSISEVRPMKSNLGIAFASTRDDNGDFKVIKKDIHTHNYTVKTGFSKEVWQDMTKMFGKDAKKSAGKILSGLSSQDENFKLITYLDTNSDTKDELIVNTDTAGWITSQISQKVAESVLEMNRHSFKTLESFCILSGRWSAAFLGTAGFVKNDKESNDRNSLFVGRYGNTDYYLNPFPNTASQFNDDYDYSFEISDASPDYCYVGLKSDVPGESSMLFAPYMYEMQYVNDPDTLELNLFLHNRYGLETSPLHEPLRNRSVLHKFKISGA